MATTTWISTSEAVFSDQDKAVSLVGCPNQPIRRVAPSGRQRYKNLSARKAISRGAPFERLGRARARRYLDLSANQLPHSRRSVDELAAASGLWAMPEIELEISSDAPENRVLLER
jgi:hypothetical protein